MGTLDQYKDETDNICVIITDGQENASKRFNQKQVFDKIKDFTENKDWMFQYLGANQDAFAVGGSMGITSNMSYGANKEGFQSVYNAMEAQDLSAPPPQFESFDAYKMSKSAGVRSKIMS